MSLASLIVSHVPLVSEPVNKAASTVTVQFNGEARNTPAISSAYALPSSAARLALMVKDAGGFPEKKAASFAFSSSLRWRGWRD